MSIWQILIIGLLGLFLKYVISVILSTPLYEKEESAISNEEYKQYIEQSNHSVQKDSRIVNNIDASSVFSDGMSLMENDNFIMTTVEV